MLKLTGAAIAGTALLGANSLTSMAASQPLEGAPNNHSKKALIIGSHPDDPETG